MRFSVIMPSRLVPYQNSAQMPEDKFRRAVNSILDQTFTDFELNIISDGCEITKGIVTNEFKDKRVNLIEVRHKVLFDNLPRNTGISKSKGEYIVYCDIDDWWGGDHLKIINEQLSNTWVWFNDIIYDDRNEHWIERACNIRRLGSCGTSNICHASRLQMQWDRPGYAHDFHFVQKLLRISDHQKISTPEYFVCHIPGVYDL